MSDAALQSRPWPGHTSKELQAFIDAGHERSELMAAEIARRVLVEAGDVSVMFPTERLRHAQAGQKAANRPAEDLTPEGIQLVIPGAERRPLPTTKQGELF